LIFLDFGGEIVDTPGVRELGVSDISREALAHHFVELEPYLGKCRFKSCSHIPEPGCAVKEAVEAGKIYRPRYESYEKLYHELVPKRP
jgi:ribosome biogenesis GTPase